jgi:hypothetical protein
MNRPFLLKVILLSGLLLGLLWNMSLLLVRAEGIDDLDDRLYTQPYPATTPASPYPYPYPPSPYYSPYPPIMPGIAQPPPPRTTWLGKLLRPFVKHASPPILQAPKTPKEAGKEPAPRSEPLIRLPHAVTVEGVTVPAGFYLIGLVQGGIPSECVLTLNRQQHVILRVKASGTYTPSAAQTHAKETLLPAPPQPVTHKDLPVLTPSTAAKAYLQGIPDTQTLILVYELGGVRYTSEPMPVVEHPAY